MKNRIFKSILALLLILVSMPMMGQDYMNIFFKDGSHLIFFMPSLKELYVSNYDSEGYFQSDYKYQYLVTNSGKYVYDLSDIDYITYTKCDEEEVEQNIVNSVSTIIPILEECSSITEVEKRLDDVKMAEGIEDAWSDGSQLCVKIKDWGTMAFHFHDESYDDDDDAWEAKVMKKMASLRPIIKKAVANGKTLKVAIANQTKNNDMPSFTKIEKRFQKIISLFESLGINPVPVDPTIDFFRTGMYEYDFVVLCTHGSIMTDNKGRLWYDEFGDPVHFMFTSDYLGAISKTYFSTNEPSNEELKEPIRQLKTLLKQKGLEDYFSNDEIRVDWIEELRGFGDYWIAYPLVTENFIRDASESQFSNPNSILFAAVCHSLEGKSSLANKLQDKKNLGSYLGYDGEIDTGKGSNAALSFIMSLLSGYSIKKSEENIPDEYKIDTSFRKNTKLVPELSNNGQDFLFPTVTKQIDQTTAQNAFNSFGYVEVEGNTTCIDPNADDVVKMGFQYSTNENFSPASSVVSSDVIKLTKPLDNGNGNVQFRAQLTGLQPGNTYFYRAYTYDGLNYNYGEPCPLEISGGETNITEGLVAYYPFNGNANDASGNGNHGILSGNNPPVLTTDRHGRENSAYSFGGFKNYNWIKVPNSESLKFDKEMTISFWIQQSELAGMDGWGNYSTTSPSFAVICKAGDGIATYPGLYILTGKGKDGNGLKISNNISNGVLSIGYNKSDYQLGNWLHIVLVVNKSDKILYVDGIEVAHDQLNKENIFSSMNAQDLYFGIMASSNMTLGRYGSGAWYPFYGKIDDIRFYNRALDPSEISVLYNE